MNRSNVSEMYRELAEMYPEENFGSYSGVFNAGLNEGVITEEEYSKAKKYYGKLWNYTGD